MLLMSVPLVCAAIDLPSVLVCDFYKPEKTLKVEPSINYVYFRLNCVTGLYSPPALEVVESPALFTLARSNCSSFSFF